MFVKQSSTAILFFSRSARVEDRFKSLQDSSSNLQLIEALQANAISQIRKSNLPFFIYDEEKQKGNSFGERIGNAFEEVFTLGYENVISVGNDCPDLKAADLEYSALQLSSLDLVIGPDHRGGAYLIGISKSAFDRQKFESLSWQTNHLLDSLIESVSTSRITLLTARFDLNTKSDVLQLRKKSTVLANLLKIISFNNYLSISLQSLRKLAFIERSNNRRGPPVAA